MDCAAFGLMAIHNRQLAVSSPKNTYFNKITRTIRLLLNPAEDELEQHLIGKNISCDHIVRAYVKKWPRQRLSFIALYIPHRFPECFEDVTLIQPLDKAETLI